MLGLCARLCTHALLCFHVGSSNSLLMLLLFRGETFTYAPSSCDADIGELYEFAKEEILFKRQAGVSISCLSRAEGPRGAPWGREGPGGEGGSPKWFPL